MSASTSALIARFSVWEAADAMDSVQVITGRSAAVCRSGKRFATLTGMTVAARRCRMSSAVIA